MKRMARTFSEEFTEMNSYTISICLYLSTECESNFEGFRLSSRQIWKTINPINKYFSLIFYRFCGSAAKIWNAAAMAIAKFSIYSTSEGETPENECEFEQ